MRSKEVETENERVKTEKQADILRLKQQMADNELKKAEIPMIAANKAIAMLNKENIYDLKAVKVANPNI